MKRVVFVVPMLAPYAIERFEELAKNKEIELHVIAEKDRSAARNGSGWDFQEIQGCKTYLLNAREYHYNVKNDNGGYAVREARKFSFGLKKLVNKIQPDVVLVCNSTQIAFLLGPRKYKLGVIVEDTLRAEEGRKQINRLVKRILLNTADFYVPFNNDAEEFLNHNHIKGERFKSTWSVNLNLFNSLNTNEKLIAKKKEYELDAKKQYTIVAALIKRKGIVPFLQAWKVMPREFQKQNCLNIIGDGPLKQEIEEFIQYNGMSNVRLVGNLPYAKVGEFLQCSDIFVLPTLEDVWGLVTMEAMASGIPVLTTIYAGSRELIEEGRNGFVFDSLNIESTVTAIEKSSTANLEIMKKNARTMIARFSNETVMKQFAEDLFKVIE